MPSDLPPELAIQADRLFAQFDRGLVTVDELENELVATVHDFAGEEFERGHLDWATGGALLDQIAWETRPEVKRQTEAEVGAEYALALAEEHRSARGLVGRVFDSPQWRKSLGQVQASLIDAAAAGLDSIEAVSSTGWRAAWLGVLPPEVRDAVRNAPLDSEAAMIDLLESDREGDAPRVAQIVAASGRRGCVSPAVQVLRLRRSEGRPAGAAEIAGLLDHVDLADRSEFGGMTHMAAELLAGGEDTQAAEWSCLVDDTRLFHASVDPDRDALRSYHQDQSERTHGPSCVRLCNDRDARLLGALALVDWIGGAQERAENRARACDAGSDTFGWSAAGVELLAGWVLSRRLGPADRISPLLKLIERSIRARVDLGLLGVQVHTELAELSTVAGNPDAAAHHRARADWFRSRPTMHLHFEPFQFPSLLSRLPLAI